ncbi:High affinity cAMP-specific and IBMX-insensitive 3',5'-cyclic phosphodiesterase 9A [Clydaea vesicula]|uniref:Phosphodiesterase n=1 Tax=Clydaea vesicula TaxID=447962 RepID=A0AAD5U2T7_9FUNG|nr:High affinity cAMP-specific and IBMX-insensitive 3',5'-cyclic phosphodiesterase 9A [Clydaea vesicula]
MSFTVKQRSIINQTMNQFLNGSLTGALGMHFNVWDWNLYQLYGIILATFVKLGLVKDDLTLQMLLDFVIDVKKGYPDNPYHSFLHAVDVEYMMYYILIDLNVKDKVGFSTLECTSLLISALTHDIKHPGKNNLFQVNAQTELAKKYCNESVLEAYSCDILDELLSKHKFLNRLDFGILPDLVDQSGNKLDKICFLKETMREAIINTDMCYHFLLLEQLNIFDNNSSTCNNNNDTDDSTISSLHKQIDSNNSCIKEKKLVKCNNKLDASTKSKFLAEKNCIIIPKKLRERRKMVNILLHAADISNAARPFKICKKWSDMIVEEFFLQGECELRLNLPVSPSMDSTKTNQIKIAIQFEDLIARPFFEALSSVLIPLECYLETLISNRVEWLELLHFKKDKEKNDVNKHVDTEKFDFVDQNLPSSSNNANNSGNKSSEGFNLGRRLSTAAGTIEIPANNIFGQRSPNVRYKRHSFSHSSETSANRLNFSNTANILEDYHGVRNSRIVDEDEVMEEVKI